MPSLKLITFLKFKIKELTNKEIEGKYNTSQEATISMLFFFNEILRKVNRSNVTFKVFIKDHFRKRNRN